MGTALPRARILVAEDDASAREVIVLLLEGQGYDVTAVADGTCLARALRDAEAREQPFDLVVSDVRMPGEGTFSVLRGARAAGRGPRTILLTAYPEDSVFFNAYQCDCLCVISKPFDATELRRIVGLVLAERGHGGPRRVDLV